MTSPKLRRWRAERLAFSLLLLLAGVSLAVVGMKNPEELLQNIEQVRGFRELDEAERQQLLATGSELSGEWGPHFGPAS